MSLLIDLKRSAASSTEQEMVSCGHRNTTPFWARYKYICCISFQIVDWDFIPLFIQLRNKVRSERYIIIIIIIIIAIIVLLLILVSLPPSW